MENNTGERIKRVIVEHLGVEASIVTDSAKLVEDLGADSLDSLDLVLAVNEEFGTHIPAEKLPDIHTVKQLQALVEAAISST